MDGPGFDLWTRRHVGRAAGGFAAATLAFLGLAESGASKKKRKRRRKRCKRLGNTCRQGGKRKCCGDLRCDHHGQNSLNQTFCCKTVGKPCQVGLDCCAGLGCCGLAEPTCQPVLSCL